MGSKKSKRKSTEKSAEVQLENDKIFADSSEFNLPKLDLSLDTDGTLNSDEDIKPKAKSKQKNKTKKVTDLNTLEYSSGNEDSTNSIILPPKQKQPARKKTINPSTDIDEFDPRIKEEVDAFLNNRPSNIVSNNNISEFENMREDNFEGNYSLDSKTLFKFGVKKEDLYDMENEYDIDHWINNRKNLSKIGPDYDSDSSTDMPINTIGNVPIEWYSEYDHIGYDLDGKKISKPKTEDEMDKFLKYADDPAALVKIRDELSQLDVKLTDEEIDIIERVQKGEFPDADFNPYQDTVEWFTSKKMETPLTGAPLSKSSFVPSKWEHKMVMRIVRSIRNGELYKEKEPEDKNEFYDIWSTEATEKQLTLASKRIPPPKSKLPTHDESYHPPTEYLPTEEEVKAWKEIDKDDRKLNYLPTDYEQLRTVPLYKPLFSERFQRCLDLYLAPRLMRTKLNIDPDSLIPKLPDPKDLLPFPTSKNISYNGHTDRVRSMSIDNTGNWLITGSEDKTIKLWEILTGYCLATWQFDETVYSVSWNPNPELCLFVASVGEKLIFVVPKQIADPNSL
ncbi:Ribosome biogenesis protein BOP1, partial [Smittium culicis]